MMSRRSRAAFSTDAISGSSSISRTRIGVLLHPPPQDLRRRRSFAFQLWPAEIGDEPAVAGSAGIKCVEAFLTLDIAGRVGLFIDGSMFCVANLTAGRSGNRGRRDLAPLIGALSLAEVDDRRWRTVIQNDRFDRSSDIVLHDVGGAARQGECDRNEQ